MADADADRINSELSIQKTKVKSLEYYLFLRNKKQNFFSKVYASLGFGKVAQLRREHSTNQVVSANMERDKADSDGKVNSLKYKLHAKTNEAKRDHARYSALIEESRHTISIAKLKYQEALNQRANDNNNNESQLQRDIEILSRRINRLTSYIKLEKRWAEMQDGSGSSKRNFADDIGDEIFREANLVCSTSSGIGGAPSVRNVDFDTLIMDESSRVTDSEFLVGAVKACRWILVGDEKQLPPYTEPQDEYHLHALAAIHMNEIGAANSLQDAVTTLSDLWAEDDELHRFRKEAVIDCANNIKMSGVWEKHYKSTFIEAYDYFKSDGNDADKIMLDVMRKYLVHSLFDRCVSNCLPSLKQKLILQRRMIDPIAAIVRHSVYAGEYRSPEIAYLEQRGITPLTTAETFYRPITFLDTSLYGNEAAEELFENGFINKLEQKWIIAACKDYERELIEKDEKPITVSILCFYKAQAREISRKLNLPNPREFRKLKFRVVDAIDKIQGQESDLVIISFCRARVGKKPPSKGFALWLQDLRRLNVACTRARRALVLVGHKTTLERLNGITEAKLFYKNLFDLFQNNQDTMGIVKNYQGRRG